jgi:hypothetical protein
VQIEPFLGPLGGFVLSLSALIVVAREFRKQIDARITNLRADMEYERNRATVAEERLDAFREQNVEMTSVLREAVALTNRVLNERASK